MIETPRLILRPMRDDDVEDLLQVFSDPRVMAAFGSPPFDRAQMARWVRSNLVHQERHGYGLFSVILRESGRLIGDCGLEWKEIDGRPEAELGYDLRSDYWGCGLATEAATTVRDYAFGELVLPRLVSLIQTGNVASRRVVEKVGMHLDREMEWYGRRYWLYALHAIGQ